MPDMDEYIGKGSHVLMN